MTPEQIILAAFVDELEKVASLRLSDTEVGRNVQSAPTQGVPGAFARGTDILSNRAALHPGVLKGSAGWDAARKAQTAPVRRENLRMDKVAVGPEDRPPAGMRRSPSVKKHRYTGSQLRRINLETEGTGNVPGEGFSLGNPERRWGRYMDMKRTESSARVPYRRWSEVIHGRMSTRRREAQGR